MAPETLVLRLFEMGYHTDLVAAKEALGYAREDIDHAVGLILVDAVPIHYAMESPPPNRETMPTILPTGSQLETIIEWDKARRRRRNRSAARAVKRHDLQEEAALDALLSRYIAENGHVTKEENLKKQSPASKKKIPTPIPPVLGLIPKKIVIRSAPKCFWGFSRMYMMAAIFGLLLLCRVFKKKKKPLPASKKKKPTPITPVLDHIPKKKGRWHHDYSIFKNRTRRPKRVGGPRAWKGRRFRPCNRYLRKCHYCQISYEWNGCFRRMNRNC